MPRIIEEINIYIYDDFSKDKTFEIINKLKNDYKLNLIEGKENIGTLNGKKYSNK